MVKLQHTTLVQLAADLQADYLNNIDEEAARDGAKLLRRIAYSEGRAGVNGAIWTDDDGNLYYASRPCPALSIIDA